MGTWDYGEEDGLMSDSWLKRGIARGILIAAMIGSIYALVSVKVKVTEGRLLFDSGDSVPLGVLLAEGIVWIGVIVGVTAALIWAFVNSGLGRR